MHVFQFSPSEFKKVKLVPKLSISGMESEGNGYLFVSVFYIKLKYIGENVLISKSQVAAYGMHYGYHGGSMKISFNNLPPPAEKPNMKSFCHVS